MEVLRLHRTKVVAGPAFADFEKAFGESDPEGVLRVWSEIADVATVGATPLATGDSRLLELDRFSKLWGPRALSVLYLLGGSAELDDLRAHVWITPGVRPGQERSTRGAGRSHTWVP